MIIFENANRSKRYQQTIGSFRKTPIGLLPEEWDYDRLDKVCNVKTGPFGAQLHEADYVSRGTPMITVEHLGERNVIHKNLPRISDEDRMRLDQYILNAGDIVFSRVGSIDRNVLISEREAGWLFSGRLLRVRTVKDKVFPAFISAFFNLDKFKQHMRKIAVGGTMPSINTNLLCGVIIPIPTIDEQMGVVSILSTWDRAIELKEKLLEQKSLQKKGLMERLLTGKVRLPGFNKKWSIPKAGEVFRNVSDKTHGGIGPVLSSMQDQGIVPRNMINIDIKFDLDSVNTYKKVEIGDFVISLRSFQGGIEYSPFEGIISPAYTVLRNKIEMDCWFYKYFFKSNYFIKRLNTVIYGIRDGKQISYNEFSQLKIPYPDPSEQMAIADFLEHMDREIAVISRHLDLLKLQKKGLMQLLLTGKVRVPLEEEVP